MANPPTNQLRSNSEKGSLLENILMIFINLSKHLQYFSSHPIVLSISIIFRSTEFNASSPNPTSFFFLIEPYFSKEISKVQDGRASFLPQPKTKLMRSFYVGFERCTVMLISQTTKIGQVLCFKMAVIQTAPFQ